MAGYYVFNQSYNTAVQFASDYDYNVKECLTIPPRSGIGGTNDILGNYFTSIDYGRHKMISEIFAFAAKNPDTLQITKDGQAIDYATYKQDFP